MRDDLYERIGALRAGGRRAVLAIVIAHRGASPRKDAAKMLLGEDGSRYGSVGGGLVASGDALKGFAVAGADGKYIWAQAKIDGATVVVSSDAVAEPVSVRYAWADNPECNLYNAEGLPASPFQVAVEK